MVPALIPGVAGVSGRHHTHPEAEWYSACHRWSPSLPLPHPLRHGHAQLQLLGQHLLHQCQPGSLCCCTHLLHGDLCTHSSCHVHGFSQSCDHRFLCESNGHQYDYVVTHTTTTHACLITMDIHVYVSVH